MENVLDIECSMFENAKTVEPINVNLLRYLKSTKFLIQQEKLRIITNEDVKKSAKLLMPCITPSGIFTKRNKNSLLQHTGLIAINIDLKDNQHISNFKNLKEQLCKLNNVAYCGLSVSGSGYWIIIPITHPDKHEDHFKVIELYFKSKGLNIDSACKNVDRLRFYSYDDKAYYNVNAKPLQAYYQLHEVKYKNLSLKQFKGQDRPVWQQYDDTIDFMNVLSKNGWEICNKTGSKTYYTRPGKIRDISAEYDSKLNLFYVFTSSTVFEQKGYTPFAIYAILEHNGDFRKATKSPILERNKAISIKVQKDLTFKPKETENYVEEIQHEITNVLGEIHTGIEFKKVIMAAVMTSSGKMYDLLFNENGEFITPGVDEVDLEKLEETYNKNFKPLTIDNAQCWANYFN